VGPIELEAEIETELNKSAHDAAGMRGLSTAPTQDEVRRGEKVAQIVTPGDRAIVRQQVDALAEEYETIRSSLPSGDDRTHRMEIVVSKMRTIGRAAYPLRYDLVQSPSPGRRLQAISLQVIPDYELLDWLAGRVREEKPFISYHALVALNIAARNEHAREHLNELRAALRKAQQNGKGLAAHTDRLQALTDFEKQMASLESPVGGP
jgi:hypothetical protein